MESGVLLDVGCSAILSLDAIRMAPTGIGTKLKLALCGACVVFVFVPSIILIALSFASLDETELGIDYNSISLSLETMYSASGLYFLGLGHYFITYPRTIQVLPVHRARSIPRTHTSPHTHIRFPPSPWLARHLSLSPTTISGHIGLSYLYRAKGCFSMFGLTTQYRLS